MSTQTEPWTKTGLETLSSSESEILRDAAEGLTVRESADFRVKSPATVKGQRAAVLAKLGARNIAHAVALMARHDLSPRRSEEAG